MDRPRLTEGARRKIDSGALPREPAEKVLSHPGQHSPCDACGEKILHAEVEHELLMPDGKMLRMHVVCHGMWLADLEWRGLWGNRLAGADPPWPWDLQECAGSPVAGSPPPYRAVEKEL